MTNDFYCQEALSGQTHVKKVMETDNVLQNTFTGMLLPGSP